MHPIEGPSSFSATPGQLLPRQPLSRHHWRPILTACLATILALGVFAFLPSRAHANYALVGVKNYYLALGDSLAFGYQPNLEWSHGYAPQWYTDLQKHGSKSFTNYGCNG